MNREIEFRAWDIEAEKMASQNEDGDYIWQITCSGIIILSETEHAKEVGGEIEFVNNWTPILAEIMQYTGLKDKNGVKIFEGDIIKQGSTLCVIKSCIGGFECQILIELKNGGTIEGSTYIFSFLNENYCEVIGNIHSNPELIK